MATADEYLKAADRAEKAGATADAEYLRKKVAEMGGKKPPATRESILAASERARAAGATADADYLVKLADQHFPKPATPPAAAPNVAAPPADEPARPPSGGMTADQIRASAFATFEAANPALKGRYTPDNFPNVGELVMGQGGGGRSGGARYTVQAPVKSQGPDTWTDTASAMVSGPWEAAKSFGGGLIGGDSPSRKAISEDPMLGKLPEAVQTGLGFAGDAVMAPLSALGAGISGAVGFGTELIPGLGPQTEQDVGQGLLVASQFAVPELAGGSSVMSGAGRIAARDAATAAKQAAPIAEDVAAAPKLATPIIPAAPMVNDATNIGELVRKASGNSMGAIKAQEKLAEAAKVDPEAKAAADRLGIDLPADVFSDNEMLKSAAGMTRSQVGTENEAAWFGAVKKAKDRADEVMQSLDGSPDIASVSESVKASLQATQASLKSQAKSLYEAVDKIVPAATPVPVRAVVKTIGEMIQEVGGIKGLSEKSRRVFNEITDPDTQMTYRRLTNIKGDIQKAKRGIDSPYADLNLRDLTRLETALVEDQLAAVGAVGNAEARVNLRMANQLTAKQKALEKRIVNSFGSDLDGSIGQKLKTAVTQGAKGDIANLNRVLKVIPDDLRKQAVASALSAVTRSARATEPGFGFSEFAKVYGGILTNRPVFNLVGKSLGPEAMKLLDDLYLISRRIVSADSKVLRTGKANQALLEAITAEGLIAKVLHSTAGQRVTQAAAGGVGAVAAGPYGAMIAAPLAAAVTLGKSDVIAAAGKMFRSDTFQRLMSEAAAGGATPAAVKAVETSMTFKQWASRAGIKTPPEWLSDAFKSIAPAVGQAATQSDAPNYDALYGRY